MPKKLIVCCDGTWNLADQPSRTNVAKVALALLPHASGTEQRVHYHSGVGTRRGERLRGGAFGMGLSRNVLDAYRFLVDAYEPGDRLYLFGFSRGAFTARSLAGLVRNSGILRRENAHRTGEAWSLYRDRVAKPTGTASTLFRRAYAHESAIEFLGVWDTVGALGIPVPRSGPLRPLMTAVNRRWAFHDTELSSWVRGAFQALAIDEQRSSFVPALWRLQSGAAPAGQEVQQVWFAGAHSDVGGGYEETSLSDLALLWMVSRARRYGLEFDLEALSTSGPDAMAPDSSAVFRVRPDWRGEVHLSRTGLYRLARPLHRPLGRTAGDGGDPDGSEHLADTVQKRYEADHTYRPPELGRYLSRGPARTEPVPPTVRDTDPPPDGGGTAAGTAAGARPGPGRTEPIRPA